MRLLLPVLVTLFLTALPGCASGGAAVFPGAESRSAVMQASPEPSLMDERRTAPLPPASADEVAEADAIASSSAPRGRPIPDQPATAELFPNDPPEAQPQSGGLSRYPLPPVDWAEQELSRRGFVRDPEKKLVVLEPGHGGPEIGATYGELAEKAMNLQVALKLKQLLEKSGLQILLTRQFISIHPQQRVG